MNDQPEPSVWTFDGHALDQMLRIARETTPYQRFLWLESMIDLLRPVLRANALREMERGGLNR